MESEMKKADQTCSENSATRALSSNPPLTLRQKDDLPPVQCENRVLNTHKVEKIVKKTDLFSQ